MKTTTIIALIVFCLCPLFFNGQILDVNEDTRGKLREVDLKAKKIVDINSRLEIGISKEKLNSTIRQRFQQHAESLELDEQIKLLGEALTDQEQVLTVLDNHVANMVQQKQFFDSMESFMSLVETNDVLLARYNVLMGEFFTSGANLNNAVPEPYIFENLSKDLSIFKEEFAQLKAHSFTISLVARRNVPGGGKVHIENFDSYEEQESITIPRWVTTLSENQKEQLQELAKKAVENNTKNASLFENFKQIVKDHFPSVDCLVEQSKAIRDFVNDPALIGQLTEAVKKDATELIVQLDDVIGLVNLLQIDVAKWTITSPFEMGEQFKSAVANVKSLRFDAETFKNSITAINAIAGRATTLMNNVQGCLEDFSNDLANLETTMSLLKKERDTYVQNGELEKEILKFTLDDLPEKGYINLEGTGNRSNGDKLSITLYLSESTAEESIRKKPSQLERHDLVMHMVGTHSEVAVGMIMANPNESALDFDSEREFYFAPSASLLLKFGSRKSHFYNEFIDIGVGLNFASPDFDTDGTPEFGTGIIVTALKDILSVGYNYNVTLNAPYWFFGVNLPFNLPGIPVNTVK